MSASPYIRRATTSVLVAVGLLGGTILLLGDRFDTVPGYALSGYTLTQPTPMEGQVAACVAEESMRLIDTGRERCQPGELSLASQHSSPGGGAPERETSTAATGPADGVAGFEVVTAEVAVPKGRSAAGEARCPTGKVALGGGVLPDSEGPRAGGDPEDRMDVVLSGPLLPGPLLPGSVLTGRTEAAGYGWRARVKNTGGPALSVVVAALCVTLR
jgi:hypothetical protein